jgi:hypothetical protein
MKTPDEIKKGLECCVSDCMSDCNKCPYDGMPCNDMGLQRDALAYIQQLEAQIPKWISMEENPPEEDVGVLVCVDGCVCMSHIVCKDMVTGENVWVYTGLGADSEYWMPLPEPPKEER